MKTKQLNSLKNSTNPTEVVKVRLIPPLTILIMLLATSLLAVIPTPELNETTNPMMVDTTEYEVVFLTILEPSDGYIYRSGEPVGMRILVANLGTQEYRIISLRSKSD